MIRVAPNSFEALTSALYGKREAPTSETVLATDIHAAAIAAEFDEQTSRAIGFDPRITERNLLEAAIEEAKAIRDVAAFAARAYPHLAAACDLHGAATDFIRARIPASQFRRDIVAMLADLDEHIDTTPKKARTEADSTAAAIWQKRNTEAKGTTK